MVERRSDLSLQAGPELASEAHFDLAAAVATDGREFPRAAGHHHVGVDDGLMDGSGLRPVVAASLPEDTDNPQPLCYLGEVCSLVVHYEVLGLGVPPHLLAVIGEIRGGANHLFGTERRRCGGCDVEHAGDRIPLARSSATGRG